MPLRDVIFFRAKNDNFDKNSVYTHKISVTSAYPSKYKTTQWWTRQ